MTTREQIIAAAKEAGFSEKQWAVMVYLSGPYEIATPTYSLERLYAIAHEDGRVAGFAASVEACQAAGPQEYPNKLITDGYVEAIRARSTKKQGLDDSISNLKPEDDCGIRYVE